MNILLIRPPSPIVHAVSFGEKTFPIGMAFLLSVLREHGHTVYFKDLYLEPDNRINEAFLAHQHIDIIGIYACSITYPQALRLLEQFQLIRERGRWKGILIAGGPHASIAPHSFPEYVDHIVIGEGEQALLDIVEGRCRERIVRYPRIKNLDELPFPAYDIMFAMPYNTRFAMMDKYVMANMNTSRGCPYHCRFCSVDSIWGGAYSTFSAERVVEDIQRLIRDFRIEAVYFREDNFLANRARTCAIGERLLTFNAPLRWGCEARVDALQDEEYVRFLSKTGCEHVFLGIESLSQRVLDLMNKKITVDQALRAIDLCRRYGILVFGSFIVGSPGETREEINLTIERARELFPAGTYALNTFMGFPYSEMYRDACRLDMVDFRDVSDFLYTKQHDELMLISMNGDVPLFRRSPRPFVSSPLNLNNLEFAGEEMAPYLRAHTLVIAHPRLTRVRLPRDGEWIAFEGLRKVITSLKSERYDTILLLNILHLMHPESIPLLLEALLPRLQPKGHLIGMTLDRGQSDIRCAVMENYASEYVYNLDEIRAIFAPYGEVCFTPYQPWAERGIVVFDIHKGSEDVSKRDTIPGTA